jgi:hypothetical protein
LKTNPDIDIKSCYKKALDTCEELKISYDNLNLKEIIRMKIRIKEATIQTNLDQFAKANIILDHVKSRLEDLEIKCRMYKHISNESDALVLL